MSLVALSVAGALGVAGCGNRQSDGQAAVSEPAPATVAEARGQATSPEGQAPVLDTNAAPPETGGGATEFMKASLESPFATADLGLKESYNRALIAFQIGDYPQALSELQDLGTNGGLSAEQRKAVQKLLEQTRKATPGVDARNALATTNGGSSATTYPLAAENEAPFSTADPAVRETFARAKAAYEIGNYSVAAAELKELLAKPALNAQQKYEAQLLLDRTPQAMPATPAAPLDKSTNR